MDDLVAEAGRAEEGAEPTEPFRAVPRFLQEFAARGGLGRLPGIQRSRGDFEKRPARRITVLPDQDELPRGVHRHDRRRSGVAYDFAPDDRPVARRPHRLPRTIELHPEQSPPEPGAPLDERGGAGNGALRHEPPQCTERHGCARIGAARRLPVVLAGLFLLVSGLALSSSGASIAGDTVADLEGEGARLLFNYDFEEADRVYRRLSEEFRDHPSGPYNRAAIIWTRLAQRSGGMRGSSHRGDRYWTQTRTPEVTIEEEALFHGYLAEALERSDRALEGDPGDLEILYYRGASEALESGWEIIVRRSYIGGFRSIRKAVGRHRRILEEDPDFVDARVVPGAYDYGVATLPRALRVLAFLFGVRGNQERGLDWVSRTASEGIRARWGALWTFAVLMQRERRFDEALAAVRELQAEFPRNPDYALEEIGILISRGNYREARFRARAFLQRRDAGFGNYRLAADGLAELRLGESFLFEQDWKAAEEAFSMGLLESPVSELRAMLHFRRGNARDGSGRRREALGDYLRVRQIGADEVLAEWAGRLRKTPWPGGAPEGASPE